MMRFEGKVALVSGGQSGIGRAIAERLAKEGAWVVTAQRTPDTIFDYIQTDFADPDVPLKVIAEVLKKTGRLDVLVNNAGIMEEARVEETSLEAWNRTLQINLTSPFLMIKHALPQLRKHRGNIINIGSIEGLGNNPLHGAYGASKAGLHGLTRAVAVDHGEDGVRCNAVAPGWIDTDLNTNYIASMADPLAFQSQLGSIHPIGRSGKPEEIASVVAFLASEDASFITGQVFTVDGGRMTKLSLP